MGLDASANPQNYLFFQIRWSTIAKQIRKRKNKSEKFGQIQILRFYFDYEKYYLEHLYIQKGMMFVCFAILKVMSSEKLRGGWSKIEPDIGYWPRTAVLNIILSF